MHGSASPSRSRAGVWRGPSKTWAHPDAQITDAEGVDTLDGGSVGPSPTASSSSQAQPRRRRSRMSRPARSFKYTGSVPAGQKLLIDTSRWRATLGARRVLGIDLDERHSQHRRHRATLRHHTIPTYADTWAQPGRRSHHGALRQVHRHRHHVGHGGPDSGTHFTLVGEHLGFPLRRIRPPDWH